MAFLSGLGALTGLFSNSKANRTSTLNGTQTGTTSGTSTNTQNLTPSQTALQGPLFSQIENLMTPAGAQATVAPFTAAARDSTNSTYGGLADTLRQQFMTTGNGQSGKFGNALVQGNLQRLGALQGVDTAGQEEAAALPLQADATATSLLEHPFSQTNSNVGSSSNTTNETSVGPGSPLAGLMQGLTAGLTSGSNSLAQILAAINSSGGSL